MLYHIVGIEFEARKDLPAARQLHEGAIKHQRSAIELEPKNSAEYRNALYKGYGTLADVLLRLGAHAEAAQAADEQPRALPGDWRAYRSAAAILTMCIAAADKDPQLAEPKRKESAEHYAAQAVAMLRQAVAHGYKGEGLKDSPEILPLRAREDFKRLLDELEQKKR